MRNKGKKVTLECEIWSSRACFQQKCSTILCFSFFPRISSLFLLLRLLGEHSRLCFLPIFQHRSSNVFDVLLTNKSVSLSFSTNKRKLILTLSALMARHRSSFVNRVSMQFRILFLSSPFQSIDRLREERRETLLFFLSIDECQSRSGSFSYSLQTNRNTIGQIECH